jgi:hypothetical protein
VLERIDEAALACAPSQAEGEDRCCWIGSQISSSMRNAVGIRRPDWKTAGSSIFVTVCVLHFLPYNHRKINAMELAERAVSQIAAVDLEYAPVTCVLSGLVRVVPEENPVLRFDEEGTRHAPTTGARFHNSSTVLLCSDWRSTPILVR